VSWRVAADALLFDLDGTLVDSHASIVAGWTRWAERYEADLTALLALMPGRPGIEVMRQVRPDLPDSVHAREEAALTAAEIADAARVVAMPGAAALLGALPAGRWAVVTACTRELALARLGAAGLPVPAVLIGSDSVAAGKPDPAGYLAAARQLDVTPERSVVIEDAPAGVAAGQAAGMRVVALPPAATGPAGRDCLTVPALRNLHTSREGHGVLLYADPA
jgi:sugar-phosphatase